MPPKAPLKAKGAPSSSPDSKKSATNSRTSAKSVSPSRPDRPDKSDKVEKVVVPVEIKKTRGEILAEARATQLEASLKAQESSDPTCNEESHKHRSSHDIGEEFIKKFFLALDSASPKGTIEKFYHHGHQCSLSVCGLNHFQGQLAAAAAITNMYKGLVVKHTIYSFEVEHSKHGHKHDLVLTCHTTIQIESDSPRKVLQILEVRPTHDEEIVAVTGGCTILRHSLASVGVRPLFHLPEQPRVPRGRNDNWDPALAHLRVDCDQYGDDDEDSLASRSKSVTGEGGGAEAGLDPEAAVAEEEKEDDDDDDGDDGDDDDLSASQHGAGPGPDGGGPEETQALAAADAVNEFGDAQITGGDSMPPVGDAEVPVEQLPPSGDASVVEGVSVGEALTDAGQDQTLLPTQEADTPE